MGYGDSVGNGEEVKAEMEGGRAECVNAYSDKSISLWKAKV